MNIEHYRLKHGFGFSKDKSLITLRFLLVYWNKYLVLPTFQHVVDGTSILAKSAVHKHFNKFASAGILIKVGDRWTIKDRDLFLSTFA